MAIFLSSIFSLLEREKKRKRSLESEILRGKEHIFENGILKNQSIKNIRSDTNTSNIKICHIVVFRCRSGLFIRYKVCRFLLLQRFQQSPMQGSCFLVIILSSMLKKLETKINESRFERRGKKTKICVQYIKT